MNIIINKSEQINRFSTGFFYVLYICLCMYYPMYSFTRQTFPQFLDQLTMIYHILLLLLLVKIILQKNSIAEWFILAVLLYLCCKSYQYNYDFYNIFGTMMFLLCAKNLDLHKIIRLDLCIRIIRSILFFTLPFCGLMINKINIPVGGRLRTFFGWTHPNMMGLDFLLLSMDIFYLRKGKRKWYDIILYLGFIILLDVTANSRTAEAAILLLIIVHLFSLFMPQKAFYKLLAISTAGAFLTSVLLPAAGSYLYLRYPDFVASQTGTLGSRFSLTARFYEANEGLGFYGFPLYGDDCLDMLFAYTGLHWGICATVILLAAMCICLYSVIRSTHTDMLVLLLLFFVYSCLETAQIYPAYSYFTLIIGYYALNFKRNHIHHINDT